MRNRLLCFIAVLLGCLPAMGQNTLLAGTMVTPNGTGFNGTLYLSLPIAGAAFSSCSGGPVEVLPNEQVVVRVVNGVLQSPPHVWGADCMMPLNLPYNVKLVDGNGNVVLTDLWLITGSTYNVATASSVDSSPYNNPSLFSTPIQATAGIVLPNTWTIGHCLVVGTGWVMDHAACATAGSGITSLIGDVTSSGSGVATTTLAASGVAAGTYANPSSITVDAKGRITNAVAGGTTAVTSVGLAVPTSIFSISGTPITSTGTFTVALLTKTANTFFAGPIVGGAAAPAFRAIDPSDLPVASNTAFGATECDNVTITCAGGVMVAAAPGSSVLTTKGDLLGFTTLPARLGVGPDTYVLTADSGQPYGWAWEASPSGFANPMTTLGDVISGGASGVPTRLGIGSAGQVLTVVSGAPAWTSVTSGLLLQTATTSNANQSTLNFVAGAGMSVTNSGADETFALNQDIGDVPTGTLNGTNVTFVLAHSPSPASSLALYYNGLRQRLTTDYTLSGATITFLSAPTSGGLLADYLF